LTDKKLNTLIAIGTNSAMSCYLNVPLDDAKLRYKARYGLDPKLVLEQSHEVLVFEFDDEFEAYDIWPILL